MSTLKKILLVDDDDDLRDALADQLVLTEEFDVFEGATGAEGMDKAKAAHHDLIILDVALPDMDGREVCRLMRKQGIKTPILMLTGTGFGFRHHPRARSGANDYVTKPFRFGVLLARIRAQLAPARAERGCGVHHRPYTFKPSAKLLVRRRCARKSG